ncbi:unnamed protein product [Enterobius vermicularis]|uniref:Kinesin motor domain-containing protein n=1 Tax=Enterobius vermicularis TaxID=51028 RepID=A0A0N4UVD5_ENTVE|nr:unnamed protein product [Enterobius vermicularis]
MTSIGAVEDHFEDVLEAERTFERKKEVQKEPSRFLCSVRLQPAKVDKVAIESSRIYAENLRETDDLEKNSLALVES